MNQQSPSRIAQRYGGGSAWGRNALLGAGLVVVAGLIGWFVWALWLHSHPKVASSMDSWELQGDNAVKITVDVHIYDATVRPVCTVLAYAEDHSTVGVHSFTPISGRQSFVLKTERQPTSIDWQGCTAEGQQDAQ
ncbi:MAG: DUF4307 domain-containing protein [Nocardioides sp.]|uniref:DUF4307 domain-containing protein n=1 Tax=Nocardioides nematodiphilus TaxID=2849669 RepID=UPI001CD9BA29|nr:DUF4307 domain-containing protein [Nocardioides nematodiphilus]MCA1982988.1 DUF4307 domain-containing protein [Nocardioides nematodiphilus]